MIKTITCTAPKSRADITIPDTIRTGDYDAYKLSVTFPAYETITGEVRLRFARSDGQSIVTAPVTVTGNTIEYMFASDVIAVASPLTCWVQFSDSNLFTVLKITFTGIQACPTDVGLPDTNEYPELLQLIDDAHIATDAANAAKDDAVAAAGAVTGTNAAVSVAEGIRVTAESGRVEAEETRALNEQARVLSENSRVETDELRGTTTAAIEANYAPRLTGVESQLAENENKFIKVTTPENYTGPVLTFLDDDGYKEILTKWKPILDLNNIKMTFTVLTNFTGDSLHLSFPEFKALENEGHDIISHCHTHAHLNALTQAELENELSLSQSILKTNGFKNTNLVAYPYGGADITQNIKDTTRKYYEYAFDAGVYTNTMPIDNMRIQRLGMDGNTIAQLQGAINNAVANKGWLVIITHCWMETFDAVKAQQLIDYAKAQNVKILSASEALKYKGNVIGAGEFTGEQPFFVGKDGRSNIANIVASYGSTTSFTKALTAYQIGKITYELISNGSAASAPVPNVGGVLATSRFFDVNYNYQIYYPNARGAVKKRYWAGSAWGAWQLESVLASKFGSSASFNNLITAYTADLTTYELISDGNATSAPIVGVGGVLITHRFIDDNYSYQEYKSHLTKAKYTRVWSGAVWGAWEQVV